MSKQNKSPRGSIMIENIVAVAIVAIGILPLIQQMATNIIYSNTATNRSEAYSYAKDGLEKIVADGWKNYCNPDTACFMKFDENEELIAANDAEDTSEITKDGQPTIFHQYLYFDQESLVNDAYLVTMTVKWEDGLGEHFSMFKQIISK